tara:strand:+ start:371 stop:694 length:324 start_codon:yes stop_codon:yes gene_type:complete
VEQELQVQVIQVRKILVVAEVQVVLELMAVLVVEEMAEMAHHLQFLVQMSLEQGVAVVEHFFLEQILQVDLAVEATLVLLVMEQVLMLPQIQVQVEVVQVMDLLDYL